MPTAPSFLTRKDSHSALGIDGVSNRRSKSNQSLKLNKAEENTLRDDFITPPERKYLKFRGQLQGFVVGFSIALLVCITCFSLGFDSSLQGLSNHKRHRPTTPTNGSVGHGGLIYLYNSSTKSFQWRLVNGKGKIKANGGVLAEEMDSPSALMTSQTVIDLSGFVDEEEEGNEKIVLMVSSHGWEEDKLEIYSTVEFYRSDWRDGTIKSGHGSGGRVYDGVSLSAIKGYNAAFRVRPKYEDWAAEDEDYEWRLKVAGGSEGSVLLPTDKDGWDLNLYGVNVEKECPEYLQFPSGENTSGGKDGPFGCVSPLWAQHICEVHHGRYLKRICKEFSSVGGCAGGDCLPASEALMGVGVEETGNRTVGDVWKWWWRRSPYVKYVMDDVAGMETVVLKGLADGGGDSGRSVERFVDAFPWRRVLYRRQNGAEWNVFVTDV